jgi:hypothetical protein
MSSMQTASPARVDLYRIPLGAGGHSVRTRPRAETLRGGGPGDP